MKKRRPMEETAKGEGRVDGSWGSWTGKVRGRSLRVCRAVTGRYLKDGPSYSPPGVRSARTDATTIGAYDTIRAVLAALALRSIICG